MRLLARIERLERRAASLGPTRHTPAAPRPFGLGWMTDHLPHYLTAAPSRLHLDLADDLSTLHLARGQRRNVVGPRGSGKTAWSTKGYGLYVGCERIEPYILFLSETEGQAVSFLDAIRDELENNPAVAEHYPAAAGVGPVWQQAKLRLRNGVLMQARGVGGSIRGLTNRAERPTLIVVDDPNEDADAYSPTLRRRKLDWFNKAVMAVGGPDTNVVVLGTAIHREAIVCELRGGQQSGAWTTRTYRSILSWPSRADLWAEWERLFANLADPDRAATRFEQPQGVIRYTVTGADARLAQMDGVFHVLVGPPRVGAVLKVVAVSVHGPVPEHDIPQFFRATCEELIGG